MIWYLILKSKCFDSKVSLEFFDFHEIYHRIHSKLAGLIKHSCLLWELDTFGAIFWFGIVVLLEHRNYILSSGGLISEIFFVTICFVNEKINEKVYFEFILSAKVCILKNSLNIR